MTPEQLYTLNQIERRMMTPKQCPYTYDDIVASKHISHHARMKDYNNLVKFKADTNPKKFCGNKILYHYQMKNLLQCKRQGKKTLKEIMDDPQLKEKLWKDTIHRNRRDKAIYPNATDVFEANRINTGAIVFFKASTAKYIYKLFNATSVLDPTMGWGGRLLGAMSLDINYIGIDTNINLKSGYDQMVSDIRQSTNCQSKIELLWESCLDIDYSKYDYDLILTSPPYVNMEVYEHMTEWESDDAFYNKFLIPMMEKTYEHLKAGGHMCINISPKMFNSLMTRKGFKEPDDQIDLRQQMGQNYAVKSQDYIYVWKKV
tara:strand:- start:315 stop:1262 length:948 start_codon:yes stop_codon:yes gene_type:complete